MSRNFKFFDGTTMCNCWSGGRIALPLLLLAGTGAAIGIAITSSSGLWGKTVAFLEKTRKDFVLKVAAYDDTPEDRISQLPDDLLSDILSRLYVKEATRSRILSRRWNNIGNFRSELIFDCRKMFGEVQHHCDLGRRHKSRFSKAVDLSLQLHSGQKVCRLGITCCLGKKFTSYFNRWMQSIVKLGVEDLSLSFCSPVCVGKCGNLESVDPLPLLLQLLFDSASLERLHLVNCVLRPSCFKGQFNSLQTLSLVVIPLENGEFQSLLSSCVNLQRMTLTQCKLPPKLYISGRRLQLKYLCIQICPGLKAIDIWASNLTCFYCYTNDMIKCSLNIVPKLEELCLNFNGSGTVPYLFREVARRCTQLEVLVFQTRTDELRYIPAEMNMFNNLNNLRTLYLLMMVDSNADLSSIVSILDACPLLEQFRLLGKCPIRNEQRGGAWPARLHNHLKRMEFEGFRGTRHQLEFVSYVLRSASALERLRISSSYSTYSFDYQWSECMEYALDDKERRLIYRQLVGQALSSNLKMTIL